jgi:hypothetical protein
MIRRARAELGRSAMALLHLHHDELAASSGGNLSLFARMLERLGAVIGTVHGAIIAAKLRRLQSELRFHAGAHEDWSSNADADASKLLRRPLLLGDKWDF